jgi:hypothetical protein
MPAPLPIKVRNRSGVVQKVLSSWFNLFGRAACIVRCDVKLLPGDLLIAGGAHLDVANPAASATRI